MCSICNYNKHLVHAVKWCIIQIQANDLIAKHYLDKEVEGTIVWCCDQTLWLDVEEQETYEGKDRMHVHISRISHVCFFNTNKIYLQTY